MADGELRRLIDQVRRESADFRALQPCDKPVLAVVTYDDNDVAKMPALLL